ncbi:MAG TPA: DUF2628 domain-containing protein [Oligoflexia bacterium]|nr:DUF2628 domain-containing protein [Oligoflexia bacterium]HMR25019.1 DUF2628 domain-containing protein [Oligoflexia bacterium]
MKFNPKDTSQWIDRETFALYCGQGSDKLMSFYDKAKENENSMTISANWGAILVLPFWLGFRRQWPIYFSLLGIFSALPFIEAYFSLSSIRTTGATLVLGIFCNGFLLNQANKDHLKLKAKNLSVEEIQSQLKNKAAKSWPLSLLAGFGMMVIIILMYMLAETMFGPIPD